MEELAEGAIRGVLRLIRIVLIDTVCERTCYWLGRGGLYLLSLGRYPDTEQAEAHQGRITLFGLALLLMVIIGGAAWL